MASKKQPASKRSASHPPADNPVDVVDVSTDDHIKAVISETIKELHANDAVQVQKPKTLQGWIYVTMALGGGIGLVWSGIIKLDQMARHAELPHHAGVEKLVEKFTEVQAKHEENRDIHRSEAELQLSIMKETEPIKEDLHSIKQDVREIQRSVDILVEDNRRRNQ